MATHKPSLHYTTKKGEKIHFETLGKFPCRKRGFMQYFLKIQASWLPCICICVNLGFFLVSRIPCFHVSICLDPCAQSLSMIRIVTKWFGTVHLSTVSTQFHERDGGGFTSKLPSYHQSPHYLWQIGAGSSLHFLATPIIRMKRFFV